MSPSPRSPVASPPSQRSRPSKSPLRIVIPHRVASPAPPASPPALGESPDSGSDSTAEPSTPRIDAVSPYTSLKVLRSAPLVATFDEVDDLPLGSLSISKTSDLASPKGRRHDPVGPIIFMEPLANGCQARPFIVRDKGTSTQLCAKVFYKREVRADRSRESLRGMLAELRAYKRISAATETARNWLMELHAVVQDGARVLYLMDCMDNDLFNHIRKHGPVPEDLNKRWVAQLALGIDALHKMGIMHRDLKPENILVSLGRDRLRFRDSHVRITDFGHSWMAPGDSISGQTKALLHGTEPGKPLDWRLVYTDRQVGTPEYMSPELYAGDAYGPMVDWWSLGHLMWAMLVSHPLLGDEREMRKFLSWHANPGGVAAYIHYWSDGKLSSQQVYVISKLMEPEPTARYRLEHLESHPYFLLSNGRTTFDDYRSPDMPANPLPERMSPAQLIHAPNCAEPPCFVRTKLAGQFQPISEDLTIFDHFPWFSPHGLWAHLSDDASRASP